MTVISGVVNRKTKEIDLLQQQSLQFCAGRLNPKALPLLPELTVINNHKSYFKLLRVQTVKGVTLKPSASILEPLHRIQNLKSLSSRVLVPNINSANASSIHLPGIHK